MPRSERQAVFVLAILGLSPGVVTELLWHLVRRDGLRVVGVELWTTDQPTRPSGLRKLAEHFAWFRDLQRELGDEAEHLPPFPLEPEDGGLPRGPWDEAPFRVVVFRDEDGRPLGDIRDPADADRVTALLHDRVRELQRLPDGVTLVGGMAGGRKTMSAALHTAFGLQAPEDARLVHVLVHPLVERWLEDQRPYRPFGVPSAQVEAATGVVVREQVHVHDVWFPRVRGFVRASPGLLRDLREGSYEAVWRSLRAWSATEVRVRLSPVGETSQRLEVTRGDQLLVALRLRSVQGQLYRALVEQGGPRSVDELATRVGRPGQISRTLYRLVERLRKERVPELFTPRVQDQQWWIEGAAQVEVLR